MGEVKKDGANQVIGAPYRFHFSGEENFNWPDV